MPLLIYIFSFLIYIKTVSGLKRKPVYRLILWYYFASMCAAFYLWNFTNDFSLDNTLSVSAILYHILILIIMLYPLRLYERRMEPHTMYKISFVKLLPFLYFLIILSMISIITSIIIIKDLSFIDFTEIRTKTLIEGIGRELKAPGSVLSHITAFASEYSFICLILAFYCIIKYPNRRLLIVLLFISSLSYIFYNLEIGGREAIVRYVFDFIIVTILFRNTLNYKWKSRIKRMAILAFGLIFAVFLAITVSRFTENNILTGTLGYFGQGFIYFSNYFEAFKTEGLTGGEKIFGAFFPGEPVVFNLQEHFGTKIKLNVFSTYVGSFVSDLGAIKSLFPLGMFTVFCFIVSKFNSRTIFYYIYIVWIFRFFIAGIFYWIDSFSSFARVIYVLLIFTIHFFYTLSRQANTRIA